MKPKLLLIDGNSLLHRAYHAVPPLTTSSGTPTNATLGFTNMLLRLLSEQRPDFVVAAFDAPGPTFRHEQYAEYKAHRPPTAEDLLAQFGDTKEVLDALGIPRVELPGFEGEDILATLARRAVDDEGMKVVIVTGDRDVLQLVSDDVSVMATLRGISDVRMYDPAKVQELLGIRPEQVPDLKGLAGDTSDNIPGIRGIGEKTAVKLVQQFGSVEGIIERSAEIEPERVREKIVQNADLARTGRELATITQVAPVPIGPRSGPAGNPDYRRLRALLARLEFHALLKTLPVDEESRWRAEYRIADGAQSVAAAADSVRAAERVGVAVAWTGERPTAAAILGVAWAPAEGKAYFVPADLWLAEQGHCPAPQGLFDDRTTPQPASEAQVVCGILADPAVRKCGHDLKEQAVVLNGADAVLAGDEFDTMLASYVCAPGRSDHSLPRLVLETLGYVDPGAEELRGLVIGDVRREHVQAIGAACFAADAALRLRGPMTEQVESVGQAELLEQVEMPTAHVLAEMESRGIAIDQRQLGDLSREMDIEIGRLSARIWELAGEKFNVDSPKQLSGILFDKLGLAAGRRTKTGLSTSAEVLETLAEEHEIARAILEYRTFTKLKSTYADALRKLVNPRTGRVHTRLNQAVAATGRLSSSDPNLQNIPARGDWGRRIRGCFVPGQAGWSLLSVDYSQIELRILAHYSHDERLLRAFNEGQDVHVATACSIFGVTPGEVTPLMRDQAKTVNFAVLYGMGASALATQLSISREQAEEFIGEYFEKLPGVRVFIEQTLDAARRDGFVTTLMGRRRDVPGLDSQNPAQRHAAERIAVNTPIQGTAADIMKLAMIRVHAELARASSPAAMLLTVHDELLFEAPDAELSPLSEVVSAAMRDAYSLEVPLAVEAKAGKTWAEMRPVGRGGGSA